MIASTQPLHELLPSAAVNSLDALLRAQGLIDAKLTPMRGGSNNKAFRVDSGPATLFLKAYFRDNDDQRDRLSAEYAFTRLAWDHGIRTVPQPLAKDDGAGLALFEFIYGRRLDRTEINVTHLEQSLTFVRRLSTMHYSPGAVLLPPASEACFTIDEHLRLVQRRVRQLAELQSASPTDQEAASFVRNELAPAWQWQVARLTRRAEQAGLPLSEPLAERDRCISPSDFGFHNAVLEGGGRLRFVDFEYAGWDDPAKLVCDFFCQPQLPVPRQFLDAVASTVVEPLQNRGMHRQRIDMLWPIYRVKWCCIMLNLFAPAGARRRAFSGTAEDLENVKKTQLALARQSLRSLVESTND
jgi:thiamine kinase-like enzyme